MSQSTWQIITRALLLQVSPHSSRGTQSEPKLSAEGSPTSNFRVSNPASVSLGNVLFLLSEELPENSAHSVPTYVTHVGHSEGSQVSPGYNRAPKGGLGLPPGGGASARLLPNFQRGIGSRWRQLLLAKDSGAYLITTSQWWGLLAAGPSADMLLSALLPGPTLGPEGLADSQVKVLSCSCRVRLFATLWPEASQAPLSMGFSRQEYYSELPRPPPGDLPHPGVEPVSLVSCIGKRILYRQRHLGESSAQPPISPHSRDVLSISAGVTIPRL